MAAAATAFQPHPYVPSDLYLPDFVPGSLSQSTIVAVYAFSSFFVAAIVWIISGRFPKISKLDRCLMCWWAFTGLTHLIVEGYFVISPEFYKEKTGFYFAEVWKEYSKGDSRYAARDAGVVAVEGLTVLLEGPAALMAVYAIGTRKSYSCVLQLAISLGQLYGLVLYFITSFLAGDNFAASSQHYYIYFVGANAAWLVIPLLITIRCWKMICAAIVVTEGQEKSKTY